MSSSSPLYQGETGPWEAVIGLEVHAQATSNAKLFSGASTLFGAEPNTQVDFVDAAFPGMLPVINDVCVKQAIKTGLGLNAKINSWSRFDRKNYFYADLPAGYQISQFASPIVGMGHLDIELEDGTPKTIGITRLHLEQDAGKSIHDQHPTRSFIDLNRAGVALMEIVSEPDMRSAYEACEYIKKMRAILRCLGTCDGNMEQGSMRVDVNISLRRPGAEFGTRAEIKNVNSIRFMGQAIEYEIKRQMEILESGGEVVQETRLFDSVKGETRSMRSKENAHDYRYFPDPDLPPLVLTEEEIEAIRSTMPELPDAKKARFIQEYSLPPYDAGLLSAEAETSQFFEQAVASSKTPKESAKPIANWMCGDFFATLNRENLPIEDSRITPENLAAMVDLIQDGTISGRIGKDLFILMWDSQKDPKTLIQEHGMQQVSDDGAILAIIDKILSENKSHVTNYKAGQVKLFGFFVGQVMKAMAGKGNPAKINELLQSRLGTPEV